MIRQQEALLRAILEAPEDDAPRLVYADWLEERGDPRGEFIRLQCELAMLPEDDPRHDALRRREARLIHEHGEWFGPLRPFLDVHGPIRKWGISWIGFMHAADAVWEGDDRLQPGTTWAGRIRRDRDPPRWDTYRETLRISGRSGNAITGTMHLGRAAESEFVVLAIEGVVLYGSHLTLVADWPAERPTRWPTLHIAEATGTSLAGRWRYLNDGQGGDFTLRRTASLSERIGSDHE